MTVLEAFEKLGELYVARYMRTVWDNPLWDKNAGYETDPWLSLRLFLKMYAFERQGRSPNYAFAAVDAIDENRSGPLESTSAGMVWDSFRRRLEDENLNYANNPLCPKGIDYPRSYKKAERRSTVKKISAVELAVELDTKLGTTLVAWATDRLKHEGVKEAHGQLCKINGISDKIASFFLRDVASRLQHPPPPVERHLLQPIDVWVRRAVHALCPENPIDDEAQDADGCAWWILDKSAKPESANQGIWYFCAEVGHSSRYLVQRALQDTRVFKEMVREHVDELRRDGEIADAFDSTSVKGLLI